MAERNEEIGTVISTMEGPAPSNFDFVVNKGKVHRGQFVELDYDEGTLIALVNDVVKTNRYFERADSVKEFESSGHAMSEQFPTLEWEYLVAKTKPLGVFSDTATKRVTFPPSPGTRVRIASNENLERFLNFDKEAGLLLGEVEHHNLPVKLSMSSLLKKHLAILALSGGGKSHCVSVIFEELLDRKKENGRIATIVFDPHGEYSSFALPPKDSGKKDYSGKTKLVNVNDIKIGVPKLSVGIVSGIIPGLSGPQKRDLGRILNELKKQMKEGLGPFDLNDLRDAILRDESIKENSKGPLLGWLVALHELRLFGKTDNPSIIDLIKPGQLTVIDLSDTIDLKKKQVIVSYFAQRIFNERRRKAIPPFLMVFEEAHQWAPERVSSEAAISRSIIRTLAREGRKFGASICLVSQRPVQLDTTTLSQCNTNIILRITNPYDLKHISESSEGLDSKSTDMITSLRVGEALIVGEATHFPLFFKVRQRKSAESKYEVSLEKAALDFEQQSGERDAETEELL
ncbi:MAG: ATP-binding protein [archaeon]